MQWWWCPVSKFVVGVWDGLDESEISRPEILFQSAPAKNRYTPTKYTVVIAVYMPPLSSIKQSV